MELLLTIIHGYIQLRRDTYTETYPYTVVSSNDRHPVVVGLNIMGKDRESKSQKAYFILKKFWCIAKVCKRVGQVAQVASVETSPGQNTKTKLL